MKSGGESRKKGELPGGEGLLLDGLTEAQWRLRKAKEGVAQQAELHQLRVEEIKLRMQHMRDERRERAEMHAAEMHHKGYASIVPLVENQNMEEE